jgi:anti-sigma factor RsiW
VIKIHDCTGCYVVEALDEPEVAAFEAHLASCYTCGHEVADFYETTAELTLVTATKPPLELRDAIVSAVRKTPQLPAVGSVNPPGAGTPPGRLPRPV